MSTLTRSICISVLLFMLPAALFSQTTSWTGAVSTNWSAAGNWTGGIPSATKDVVIGDGSFTGAFQPAIIGASSAKTLTIGGSAAATLTVNKTLSVAGSITINPNGSLVNGKASISLSGNWTNAGSFSTTSTTSTIILNGIAQTIGGTATTTFRRLTIEIGSTLTLGANVSISGAGSHCIINGIINPGETPGYQ
ncbi:MAG TPA: hypothetical protein VEY06_15195, partial [Flavisolibacter sp.]|nr:hypothetical protein [Flavisolibacter sp.]